MIMNTGCYEKVKLENSVWFFLNKCNAICKLNLETGQIEIKAHAISEEIFQHELYAKVVYINGCFVFIPLAASSILVYRLKDDLVIEIPLDSVEGYSDINFDKTHKFWAHIKYKKNVYIFGCYCPLILKLDTENMTIEVLNRWIEKIGKEIFSKKQFGLFMDGDFDGHNAWIPLGSENKILKIDFELDCLDLIEIPLIKNGFGGLAILNDCLYLTSRGGDNNYVLEICKETCMVTKKIYLNERGLIGDLYHPIEINNEIFLMTVDNHKIGRFKNIDSIEIYNIECGENQNRIMFPDYWGEEIVFCTLEDGLWWTYNVEENVTKELPVSLLVNNSDKRYFYNVFKQRKVIIENDMLGINDMLSFLVSKEYL